MTTPPRCALIINTFNAPEYLARVVQAVSRQTVLPDEALLADDGSDAETRQVFTRWAAAQSIVARHIWQPHDGFRRARILNQAIAAAQADYLVFLDGDTLPHGQFVADHRRLARRGCFVQGHRLLVGEAAARWFGRGALAQDRWRALWRGQHWSLTRAFRWPRPLVRVRADLEGTRGCNLAIWRDDLVQVNGYNEAFKGWGREDSDLVLRLMNRGRRRLDVRGWALCYHLWHPPASRADMSANDELLAQAVRAGATRCDVGLNQYLPAADPSAASAQAGGSS